MPLRCLAILSALSLISSPALADDLLPANKPIPEVVDHYVNELNKDHDIEPAGLANDYTLIRRITLDLVGRIPTPFEVEQYVTSQDKDKKVKLVERLMASPGFVKHQAIQLDAMLNSTVAGDQVARQGSVKDYLEKALSSGKNWDTIFRDMITPENPDPKENDNSINFIKARMRDTDRLTNDVSVAFFGVNVSCAQCHDHPSVEDWTQEHFFGMKSFLSRTYDAGGFVAERPAGMIKYKPNKGDERQARLMFLTGNDVKTDTLRDMSKEEQQKEKEEIEKAKSKKEAPPAPKFSARKALVETALKPENAEFFSRNLANRIWHQMLGYGLVMPLDQIHSENPASHPELLEWLARDLRDNGYDFRRTIRGVVLSDTYARSSSYPSEAQPLPSYFAVARLKPLTPMQLVTSMKIVVDDPERFGKDDDEKALENHFNSARGFAQKLDYPTDDHQIGVSEALMFSNSEQFQKEFLGDGGLINKLKSEEELEKAVARLGQSVLSRPLDKDELEAMVAYVRKRNDRQHEAYKQVLWAMLTCPEFRFNH